MYLRRRGGDPFGGAPVRQGVPGLEDGNQLKDRPVPQHFRTAVARFEKDDVKARLAQCRRNNALRCSPKHRKRHDYVCERVITKPCPKCKGEGITTDTRELVVRVPAGVDSGTRLRVRGEGEPGVHGGPAGDLYVVLTVEQDKRWQRQGQDLIYTLEINFVQAALGHRADVPGLDGNLPLEIPKGIQSGTLLRMAGEGMPYPGRRSRGDLLVEVRVLTPTRLSAKQEELLREFEAAGEKSPLEKVKKAAKKISKAMGID